MSNDFYDEDMTRQQERLAGTADMIRQRKVLITKVAPQSGEAVLEIGSGNGILARDLVRQVGPEGAVTGLDNAEAMIAMARRICPEAEFVLSGAETLPFPDDSFDAVVLAQLLCFVDNVGQALKEIWRVLSPSGRVVALETDWSTLVWRSGDSGLMDRVIAEYTSHYVHPFLPRTLQEQMAAAGFKGVEMEGFIILNTDFGADTYARQTANFAVSLMERSDSFSAQEVTAWLGDQDSLSERGGFFFSLNRYVVLARKPA